MEYFAVGSLVLVLICLLITLWILFVRNQKTLRNTNKTGCTVGTMLVLGSGGHTREILNVSKWLNKSFYPRIYVASDTDSFSLQKARVVEGDRMDTRQEPAKYLRITRLREVGEGLWVVIYRLPFAMAEAVYMLITEKPSLLLCNGPGVCMPICLGAWFLNKFSITNIKIVFVESICRVYDLSLTGRILLKFVDEFIVQWPELRDNIISSNSNAKVHYLGRMA